MEWLRSPFGIAMYLYGMQEFLIAMMLDPEGAHRLLNCITHSRKK